MKKLLLISDNYPFGINENTFIMPELPVLMQHFEIVIASCNCTDPQTSPVPEGIKVIRIKADHFLQKVTGRLKALADLKFYRECGRIVKAGEKIADRIKWSHSYYAAGENFAFDLRNKLKEMDWQPDIIYTFWHMTPLWGVLMHKKWFGSPKVVTRAHGRDIYEFRNQYGWQSFKQESDKLLDAAFLPSRVTADYYKEHFSVSLPPKYSTAYLGTDSISRAKHNESNTLRLFSCSNVIPLKRVDLIVDTLSQIDDINIKWVHAGGGSEYENICNMAAQKLKCMENISYELLGRVPNSEVKRLLEDGSFDFFITFSETEGLPVSIMEAFAAGIPAIATAVGGIPEMVDETTGFLLSEYPDAQETVPILRKAAYTSSMERQKLSDNAYARWQKDFTAKNNAERLSQYFEILVSE